MASKKIIPSKKKERVNEKQTASGTPVGTPTQVANSKMEGRVTTPEVEATIDRRSEKSDQSGKPSARKETLEEAFERRKFIWRQVSRYGKLSYSELKRTFGGAEQEIAPEVIRKDLEFWRRLGFELTPVPSPTDARERIIVDVAGRENVSKQARSLVHGGEKDLVAQAAMGILCGFARWEAPNGSTENPEFDKRNLASNAETFPSSDGEEIPIPKDFSKCYSADEIAAELTRKREQHGEAWAAKEAQSTALRVLDRLKQFHLEAARIVALDAGTTTECIAAYISKLRTPTPSTKLSFLTVCTNSRGVFQMLGDPSVQAKTIVIGGEQRDRSEAIAGRLAELFIQSSGLLRFGITFLGATVVDLEHFECCSESQVLSRLKAILFSKSALRVVCVDHTKLMTHPMWAAYPFASIAPEQIDLVITNVPIVPSVEEQRNPAVVAAYKTSCRNFNTEVEAIERHGVPVFRALPREVEWLIGDGEKIERRERPHRANVLENYHRAWHQTFVA